VEQIRKIVSRERAIPYPLIPLTCQLQQRAGSKNYFINSS
jgi:hypothetical protein